MKNITLRNLENNSNDFEKLYKWCQNKSIYEWFEQRKLTKEEIIQKYQNKLNTKEQDLYIIQYQNKDIGLVQIYKYQDKLTILNKYNNIYEYDLFIGEEEYQNKGIGTKIINIINNKIITKYKPDTIILRPFKRNIRAIKCYQKCGFQTIYNYIDKDTIGNKEEITVMLKETMKEILINHDNLSKEEIDETVTRVKALIINDKEGIMLGYAHKTYQFPGGHLNKGEQLIDALIREIKEETGIIIKDKNLKPFEKITYYCKNYRNTNLNRQNIIYYYLIRTNEKNNINNTSLDSWEEEGNYKIKSFPLSKVEKVLLDSVRDNEINKIIIEEMQEVLATYRKKK